MFYIIQMCISTQFNGVVRKYNELIKLHSLLIYEHSKYSGTYVINMCIKWKFLYLIFFYFISSFRIRLLVLNPPFTQTKNEIFIYNLQTDSCRLSVRLFINVPKCNLTHLTVRFSTVYTVFKPTNQPVIKNIPNPITF